MQTRAKTLTEARTSHLTFTLIISYLDCGIVFVSDRMNWVFQKTLISWNHTAASRDKCIEKHVLPVDMLCWWERSAKSAQTCLSWEELYSKPNHRSLQLWWGKIKHFRTHNFVSDGLLQKTTWGSTPACAQMESEALLAHARWILTVDEWIALHQIPVFARQDWKLMWSSEVLEGSASMWYILKWFSVNESYLS